MKKIISLLMAAVLAAAMFAGCSSSSSGTTGTTSGKDGKLNPALEDVWRKCHGSYFSCKPGQ